MNRRRNQPRILPSPATHCRCRLPLAGFATALLAGLLFLAAAPSPVAAADPATNAPSATSADWAAAAAMTNQVNLMDDKYRLAIGDQLSFRIMEDEEDPRVIPVTDSGELEVPYIGRFPAVGKTCKELAQQLKGELEKTYYVHATVIIAVDSKPRSRGKIYVTGAVGTQGAQEISGEEPLTVSRAILKAGGLSSYADGKNVKVTRSTGTNAADNKSFTVNVVEILEGGKMENDRPLQPGDFIYVPDRLIRF
jgi:polysaccharide export outer membrane protein